MTRRRVLLVCGLLAAIAVALTVVLPQFLPAPVQAEVDELRSCLEIRDEEPAGVPAELADPKHIMITPTIYAFEAGRARARLLPNPVGRRGPIRGTVREIGALRTAAHKLMSTDFLYSGGQPQLLAWQDQPALYGISDGTRTTELQVKPALQIDRRIRLDILFTNSDPRMETIKFGAKVIVKEGQACFLGGMTRLSERSIALIPGTEAWPILGSWQRQALVEEEILVVIEARVANENEVYPK